MIWNLLRKKQLIDKNGWIKHVGFYQCALSVLINIDISNIMQDYKNETENMSIYNTSLLIQKKQ